MTLLKSMMQGGSDSCIMENSTVIIIGLIKDQIRKEILKKGSKMGLAGRPDSLIFPRAIYGCSLISERKNVPLIFKLAGGNSSTPHLKGLKNTNKMVFLK